MNLSHEPAVEMLYRPAAFLRMRPRTRGNYKHCHDVVYAEAHGIGLIMDVFYPKDTMTGYGVVDVIGSGWHSDRVVLIEHIGLGVIDALCDRGLTVFAVSPGSVTLFTGLQMVRHIHAAIRHIKNRAETYHIDPHCLGIMGASAGGHLAALAALAPQQGHPAAHDPLRRWTTNIVAAGVFFPPTDLLEYGGQRFDRFQIEGFDPGRLLFHDGLADKTDDDIRARLTALSPARIRVHTPPPFMIVQGKADPIVPWEQAEKLAASLRAAGGSATLVYKETGGHVWPDISQEIGDMAQWFLEMLRSSGS